MIWHGGMIVQTNPHDGWMQKNGAHVGVKNVWCWQIPAGQVCWCTVGHGAHEIICVGGMHAPTGHVIMWTVGHGTHDTNPGSVG